MSKTLYRLVFYNLFINKKKELFSRSSRVFLRSKNVSRDDTKKKLDSSFVISPLDTIPYGITRGDRIIEILARECLPCS